MGELKQKERIAPGIWIDTDGHTHISIPDIMDYFSWPHDEQHKRGFEWVVHKMLQGKRVLPELRCKRKGRPQRDLRVEINNVRRLHFT
jgi:hypothetical protein